MRRKTLLLLVIGIVGLAVVMTALGVSAQPPAGGAPGGGPGGPGGGRGDFMGMMRMAGGGAIAVHGESVYVLFMGTLFKLNADTLEIEAQVQLRPQGLPGPMGAGPGAGPGGAPPQ